MDDATQDRPGDPPIPAYRWVPGTPDHNGSPNGCKGCDFRPLSTDIRCSRIPCQRHPGLVAQLIPTP
jgi:hypothetical protein